MNTVSVIHAPLRVTIAHAPMVGAKDYELAFSLQSLGDIVSDAIARGVVPKRFWWHGRITIDGMPVEPEHWHLVRPKPGRRVHLWIPPQEPLSIGSAVGSFLFSAGASVSVVNAAIAATTFLTPLAIGVVGQLAVNALFTPPQAARNNQGEAAEANSASIQQNIPRKGQTYPYVFGTARVAPQPLCYARTYLSGDDVYAEAVLALAGPHSMTDIRVGNVPVDDDDNIEFTIDDGTAALRTNAFDAYAYTYRKNQELSTHDVQVGEGGGSTDRQLRDQSTPANSLPGWSRCSSRRNADYLDLRLLIRNPFDAGEGIVNQAIWFRLRARKVGETTWKNIATLPYVGSGQGEFRRRIRFWFKRYPNGVAANPKYPNGFLSPATLPAVTADHAVIKTADGERFPPAYAFQTRRKVEGIDIYPDDDDAETYFTAGDEYEFDLQRSEMVEESDLNDVPTMEDSSGNYQDYFDARDIGGGVWGVAENPEQQADQIYLESADSVFEDDPVPPTSTFATLQIRAKNRNLEEITCLASALVPTWDGSAFTGQSASSNPADHYRAILASDRNVDPLPAAFIDDEVLGEWREECAAQGYAVNLAYRGSIGEARALVAACGYARPLEGLKQSVAFRRDTSGERAVQQFTPRNIANYSWTAVYTKRPGAILANFLNADKDFAEDQILIEDPYSVPGATGEIEEVDFPGLTTPAEVTARGEFDFLQLRRSKRHRFTVGFEWLSSETRPGNVAILSHDTLHSQAAWARVTANTGATTFTIDADIDYAAPGSFFDLADVFASENIFAEGAQWGVAVRSAATGDVIVQALSGWTEATRTVEVTSSNGIGEDDLCVFGPLEQVTRRVLLLEVNPQGDSETAEIVCQDEGNDPDPYRTTIVEGTPIGLLLGLTRTEAVQNSGTVGEPLGMLLSLTQAP